MQPTGPVESIGITAVTQPGEAETPPAPSPPRGARHVSLWLVAAGTVAWSLFTVLDLALNGRWWLWLLPALIPPVAHLAVPLLLLALCLALAPWRPTARRERRAARWLVPPLALLVLCGAPRSGLHWGALVGDGPTDVPPDALTVFSWNTEYWDTTDDPAAFYRFLRGQDADVYLLQEYLARTGESYRTLDDLDRLRAEFPGYHAVTRGELVTLSRYPILDSRTVAGRETGEGAAGSGDWTRILRSDLAVRGHVLSVYNVHISVQIDIERSWFSLDFYRTVRERDGIRRGQLAALRRDATANPHPVLISGDFNTTPAMGDLRGLRGSFRDALSASSDFFPASWGTLGLELWRLDWTFTGDGLRVHRYAFRDPAGLSDHRAQELQVSLGG